MPGEKRFRTSLFGFKKSGVNSYIEKILREFDERLKEKDVEVVSTRNQMKEVKSTYEELAARAEQINEDRAKIADVLIKAQEKAEMMLENARGEALDEKKRLEEVMEEEKEKLVDIKQELKGLKAGAAGILKKYEDQLDVLIGSENEE